MTTTVLSIIAFVVLALAVRKIVRHKSLHPFLPRKYNFAKRRDTFRRTMELLEERQAKTLVETGVARHGLAASRGDGASTIVFGLWASKNGAHLNSVDIDPAAVETARGELEGLSLEKHVSLIVSDSVRYLEGFEQPVDFLYLDSYDYDMVDPDKQRASQEHHLKEFRAIEDRLHSASMVLIDDCRRPGGGKGKLVIDYMQRRGWTMLLDQFQVLLIKSAVK